jgi:AraC-like DNA-binding protein
MCDLGIHSENFNLHIYYSFKRKFDEEHVVNYHCHDFASLVYILSGSCSYKINDTMYQVKKGDMLVLNPGVYHGKIMKHGEEIMELHTGFGNLYIEGLPKNHLVEPGSCPVASLQEEEQDFLKCCSEICLAQESNEPGCELMLKLSVMKLVVLFLKTTRAGQHKGESPQVNFESSEKSAIVSTLMSFLNENYMRPISLDMISKSIYLSPAYISKVFKEEMGESPINYLIKIRLAKARELLLEGTHSIKAVARMVGYDDAYYFSKLYKKYHDVPPSLIKKQSAKHH